MKRYIKASANHNYEWSWEAKARQVSEKSKIGDVVNVGYLSDRNKHNYEDATIIGIYPYKYYPNGDINEGTLRYDIEVEFADGDTMRW